MSGMIDAKISGIFRYGLLALLVAAVYTPTLYHGFVWDDINIIVNNPLLEKLGNLPRIFFSEDTAMGFTGYYRPLTYVSFALDRAIWGLSPAGFHLTNLVLHLLAVLLFQAVTAALFNRERLAFVAALIFALHPVAGETVNFLAGGRNTLLSACFALLSLYCYIRKMRIPALASFTAAIFSKEFALLLPGIFLVHDYLLQREKIRFRSYFPYLIPITCYLTLRSFSVQKANFLSSINLSDMLAAPYLVVRYGVNMIYPFHLRVLYDVQPSVFASILCLGVIVSLMGALYFFRKHDEILFSACWFFLFLFPVVNIIPLESASLMADRYAYFSSMGFALFLAILICMMNRRAVTVGISTLCAVYISIDIRRNGIWKNEVEFFTRMTIDAPEKFDGYQNLGMLYYKKGEIDRALPYLTAALSRPDISAMFLIGSASVFWKENVLDQAEKSLHRALELEPANPEPYLMLITMYERNGNAVLARSYRDKAERLFHGIDKRMSLRAVELSREGEGYLSRKQFIPAENVFWQSLLINSEYLPALVGMGAVSANQGDFTKAGRYYSRVLALEPFNVSARYNLSMVYRMQGRTVEAEQEYKLFKEAEAIAKQKGNVTSK